MPKRILIAIDWYRPAFKAGGPVLSVYNLVQGLKHKFDFFIIAGDRDLHENKPFDNMALEQWTKHQGINVWYQNPNTADRNFWQRQLQELNPDLLWLNGVFSKPFSIWPGLAALGKYPVMISPRGMLHPSALKVKPIKKHLFLALARFKLKNKRVYWHATNPEEKEYIINSISSKQQVELAPNWPVILQKKARPLEKNPGELKLLVLGRIAPEKNSLFALESLLDSQLKTVQMDFYGALSLGNYAQRFMSELGLMQKEGYKVRYRGLVAPDQLGLLLEQYHYMYLPSRGENFGHAIADALAHHTPVIISDTTPWSNLVEHGVGYVLPLKSGEHASILKCLEQESNEAYVKTVEAIAPYYTQEFNFEELSNRYVKIIEKFVQ